MRYLSKNLPGKSTSIKYSHDVNRLSCLTDCAMVRASKKIFHLFHLFNWFCHYLLLDCKQCRVAGSFNQNLFLIFPCKVTEKSMGCCRLRSEFITFRILSQTSHTKCNCFRNYNVRLTTYYHQTLC